DPVSDKSRYLGLPVWNRLSDAREFDACVLTALDEPLALYELLIKQLDNEVIFIPSILGISDKKRIN
ncbi:MAG: hypothetical protein GTO02_04070, partial [Candidatus Dadabacteria bacterium]|nr:hypothetical protein [Candidatus Dadabacteria bacterium]